MPGSGSCQYHPASPDGSGASYARFRHCPYQTAACFARMGGGNDSDDPGAIRMEVENKADAYILKVTIPANMDAEVYLPLPRGKYTVTNNGAPVKVSRVKGEPFLYAGKIGSGSYTFVVN